MRSFTTRDNFLEGVGVINADIITAGQRGGLLIKTTYPGVADRVASMARSCGLRTLRTVAEDVARPWLPVYVVSVKGFAK